MSDRMSELSNDEADAMLAVLAAQTFMKLAELTHQPDPEAVIEIRAVEAMALVIMTERCAGEAMQARRAGLVTDAEPMSDEATAEGVAKLKSLLGSED